MNFEHCHIQKVAARSLIPGRIVDFGSLVFIVGRKPENQQENPEAKKKIIRVVRQVQNRTHALACISASVSSLFLAVLAWRGGELGDFGGITWFSVVKEGGGEGLQLSLRKYKGGTGKNCQFTANQLPG